MNWKERILAWTVPMLVFVTMAVLLGVLLWEAL